MSIEDEIINIVENYLKEEEYCVKDWILKSLSDIKDAYDFEIQEIRKEMNQLLDRENRMWDIIHQMRPSTYSRIKSFFVTIISKMKFWT